MTPNWKEEVERLTRDYWNGTAGDEISVNRSQTEAALQSAYERGKAENPDLRAAEARGWRGAAKELHEYAHDWDSWWNLEDLYDDLCARAKSLESKEQDNG